MAKSCKGGKHPDAAEDKKMVKDMVKPEALKGKGGKKPKGRK